MAPLAGEKLSLVSATPAETMSGANGLTTLTTFVELFAGIGSVVGEATANRFVTLPALMAVAMMTAVPLPFGASPPKSQVMTPLENSQLPCVFVAETKTNDEERRLVIRTESA